MLQQRLAEDFIDFCFPSIKDILKNLFFIVYGGSIISYLDKKFIRDVDILFLRKEDKDNCIQHIKIKFPHASIQISSPSVTQIIIDSNLVLDMCFSVRIKNPIYLMQMADFTINQIFYYNKTLYYSKYFNRDYKKRELVYTGSDTPDTSLQRIKKYKSRGFSVSDKNIKRIQKDILKQEKGLLHRKV